MIHTKNTYEILTQLEEEHFEEAHETLAIQEELQHIEYQEHQSTRQHELEINHKEAEIEQMIVGAQAGLPLCF